MNIARSFFLLLAIVSLAALPTQAQQPAPTLRLPAILSDHMVIQRDTPARVWGWAQPGETVTITLGQATATAKADDQGEWSATLAKLAASDASLEMIVKSGADTLTVRDILVGDVWVCSGQSNMAFQLANCADGPAELAKAQRPEMRFFQVPGVSSGTPLADTKGQWVVCTPATAKGFSAVGYYFGREIQQSQKVPVGLIGSNQGASRAQVWLSREALAADPDLNKIYLQPFAAILDNPEEAKAAHEKWMKEGGEKYQQDRRAWFSERFMADKKKEPFTKPMPQPPATPEPLNVTEQTGFSTVLFNARINPLVNFPIRGALWYQGEGNVNDALYDRLLSALITDWRTRWGIGDFPFLIVQLPNKSKQQRDPAEQLGGWAPIRERQFKVHQNLANVGIVASIDLGSTEDPIENNNLHPVEKENIGKRLALVAGHYPYGEKGEFSGPILGKSSIEGAKIELTFDHAADGLKIGTPPKTSLTPQPPVDELRGFAIAGADKKFVAAKAIIVAPDRVSVWSESVPKPAFVRYGWQLSPVVNLYNSADLPAFPFRTDTD
ncbi:sialate O-acetylesterase [Rariglobus hedericola]|nr:sialate O-acetylesterase [Rariglobus hedericola]